MRTAILLMLVAPMSVFGAATLFSDFGAVMFFTLFATAAVVVLIKGEFNIARFGPPQIIRRSASPIAYWGGVGILLALVAIVLVFAPKEEISVLRRVYARIVRSA